MDVLLVDRSRALGARLARFIGDVPGVVVIEAVRTGAQALSAVQSSRPDVVLVDPHLDQGGGVKLLRELKAQQPDLYLIVLTSDPSTTYYERCMTVADHCLDKAQDTDKLLSILESRASSERDGEIPGAGGIGE